MRHMGDGAVGHVGKIIDLDGDRGHGAMRHMGDGAVGHVGKIIDLDGEQGDGTDGQWGIWA